MNIAHKLKPNQYNIYADYHNLPVKVLLGKDGNLYTEKIKRKVVTFYFFEDEDVPEDFSYRTMRFSEYYECVVKNGHKYLSHYSNRDFIWHIDAYDAFTKEQLELFFKTAKKGRIY